MPPVTKYYFFMWLLHRPAASTFCSGASCQAISQVHLDVGAMLVSQRSITLEARPLPLCTTRKVLPFLPPPCARDDQRYPLTPRPEISMADDFHASACELIEKPSNVQFVAHWAMQPLCTGYVCSRKHYDHRSARATSRRP